MESKQQFRTQLIWAVVIVLAFIGYRFFQGRQQVNVGDLNARVAEMENLWYRIPAVTTTGEPTSNMWKGQDSIIYERHYPGKVDYPSVSAFYQKELPGISWQPIGEQAKVPGFTSPVRVFRNGDYHLLVSADGQGVLLRMTFSADLNPLIDQRAAKP